MEFQQIITQGCFTWNIPLPEQAPEQLEQRRLSSALADEADKEAGCSGA